MGCVNHISAKEEKQAKAKRREGCHRVSCPPAGRRPRHTTDSPPVLMVPHLSTNRISGAGPHAVQDVTKDDGTVMTAPALPAAHACGDPATETASAKTSLTALTQCCW